MALTGITLTTLWSRLHERKPRFSLKIDEQCKEYLWSSVISSHDGLSFFQLEFAGPMLKTTNRNRFDDSVGDAIARGQHNVSL